MRKIFFMTFAVVLIIFTLTATNLRGDENFNADEPKMIHGELLSVATSENWWNGDFLTATGHGVAPENAEINLRTKELAKRAAIADAYRNLAEEIGNVRITAKKNVVKKEVEAVIKFATVVSEEYDDRGNCTIVLQIPLYGDENSLASVIFPSVEKKDFPKPKKENQTKGNYTGLIIDCGDAEISPILAPEIRDKDETVYAYDNLERQKVLQRGIVEYSAKKSGGGWFFDKIAFAKSKSRAGDNPLVIKVSELSDDGTCPVISGDDADKILAENEISHFLDDGAVVFQSNRIRGMRM